MPAPRTLKSDEQSLLAKRVGADLVKHYGRKKFYSGAMMRASFGRLHIGPEAQCWAAAFFCSGAEFDETHQRLDHACDYQKMRVVMTSVTHKAAPASSASDAGSWFDGFDFDLPDLGGLGDIGGLD